MSDRRQWWTDEERDRVEALKAEGKPPRVIAVEIGRSVQAVVACLKVIKRREVQAAAPARGAGWTDEDDFTLSLLRRLGRSYPDMAEVLGRSENALRSRVCRNGVVDPGEAAAVEPPAVPGRQAWTEDDDLLLIHLTTKLDWDVDRVARFMRRTETALQARMSRIRISTTWYRRKAMPPSSRRRDCMCCQRAFVS